MTGDADKSTSGEAIFCAINLSNSLRNSLIKTAILRSA